MTDLHKNATTIMSLPLEVRHMVFEQAAANDIQTKKLLRYWFEKNEVKELIAQNAAAYPNGPAPRVLQSNDTYDDDDDESDVADEDDENQDGESEVEDEDSDQEHDDDDEEEEDIVQEAEEDDEDGEGVVSQIGQPSIPVFGQALNSATEQTGGSVSTQNQAHDAAADHDEEEDEQVEAEGPGAQAETGGELDEDEEHDEDGENSTQAMDHGEGDATATATQPLPQGPIIHPHRKWRYIPKFMRITHCPPPVELLLASKQLNNEAKNWYYDVAVLRIEATGSFAHTSFFEEAFSQITKANYSPMRNIRKVEVRFVWDTTWIRADETGCIEAIFPALLRQRANFVFQILLQAPDLKELTIHWHDSAQDDESANLRLDILEPFFSLPASIVIKEHYIATDAKPRTTTIAGKRRVEFQNIVRMGLDRLF